MSDDTSESWSYIRGMGDFVACDPMEYIRVFPRLLPRDGRVPVALRAHLSRCLAVLAWRSMVRGDGVAIDGLHAKQDQAVADMAVLGRQEHERWFPGDAADPSPAAPRTVSGRPVREREALALVAALRREIDDAALRTFDPDVAALFAFTTGIHAAYLWPDALLSHEFYTAVGWLGHLSRGRRADMPADLAEYFDDVIDVASDGTPQIRDRHLARFFPDGDVVAEVRRAVLARRDGGRAVAVWPGAASRAAADASSSPQAGEPA